MKKIRAKCGLMLTNIAISFLEWGKKTFPNEFDSDDVENLEHCYNLKNKLQKELES